jgi:hypothetical protein
MRPRQHHILIDGHRYYWHWDTGVAKGPMKTVHREQGQYRLYYDRDHLGAQDDDTSVFESDPWVRAVQRP